jgi:hypothetical protein
MGAHHWHQRKSRADAASQHETKNAPFSLAEIPWRERLRIESHPVKRRRKSVLQSAHDNDAAHNTIEFIGIQCFVLDGG